MSEPQRIHLHLPSCGPGFDPHAQHLGTLFQFIFELWWEKDKKTKRGQDRPIFFKKSLSLSSASGSAPSLLFSFSKSRKKLHQQQKKKKSSNNLGNYFIFSSRLFQGSFHVHANIIFCIYLHVFFPQKLATLPLRLPCLLIFLWRLVYSFFLWKYLSFSSHLCLSFPTSKSLQHWCSVWYVRYFAYVGILLIFSLSIFLLLHPTHLCLSFPTYKSLQNCLSVCPASYFSLWR